MTALKQAKAYTDSSIAIKKEIGELDYLKNSYFNLSEIQALMGDVTGALESYKMYSAFKDSVFNTENAKKIAELQIQYESDKVEVIKQAQQEKQKQIRNIIYSGLAIAVIFLVILLIQRNKISKERRKIALEQERTRISRDLHDDLGSGLTGILMMSEQLQSSSAKEQAGNNIEKIKQSSRQMVDQMGEIVWAMNSKNDTLENLIGYVNTYARDYLESTNINHHIQIPESIPDAMVTGPVRRNIFLVVKESLNNISKHASATNVDMQINIEANKMKIILTDNGKGFEMGQTRRFGNGLKNMQSRMTDIKGHFHIESGIQKGTQTMISFPLA
jgi:signal transduction histidine kinase